MVRMRTLWVALVVLGLVAAGTSSCSRDDRGSARPNGAATSTAPAAASTDEVIARLRDVGIVVTAADVPEPFGYDERQARNLANAAAAGTGIEGAALDAAATLPADVAPLSYFVAAWIDRAGSPASEWAGEIMGERDWTLAPTYLYPLLVLALFVHDATSGGGAPSGTGASHTIGRNAPAVDSLLVVARQEGAPCSTVANFVDTTLSSIFDAIKAHPDFGESDGLFGSIGKFFTDLYNAAVDLAAKVVRGLISALTAPVLSTLRSVLSAIALVTEISSYLAGWDTKITPDRDSPYATGTEPGKGDAGSFTMRAEGLGAEWPSALKDCAAAFDVEEPRGLAEGTEVAWTVTDPGEGMVVFDQPPSSLANADREATYGFAAAGLPAKLASSKRSTTAPFAVEGKADSKAASELRDLAQRVVSQVVDGVVSEIPVDALRDLVRGALEALLAPVRKLIADVDTGGSLLGLSATGTATVRYPVPDEPEEEDDDEPYVDLPGDLESCGVTIEEASRLVGRELINTANVEGGTTPDGSTGGRCEYVGGDPAQFPSMFTVTIWRILGPASVLAYEQFQRNGTPTKGLGDEAVANDDPATNSSIRVVLARDRTAFVRIQVIATSEFPGPFPKEAEAVARFALGLN